MKNAIAPLILPVIAGLFSSSCAERPARVERNASVSADLGTLSARLQQRIRALMMAYPEVEVRNLKLTADGKFGCAYLVLPEKPKHVVLASFDDSAEPGMTMPFIVRPGTWENPTNVRISAHTAGLCEKLGVALE